MNHNSFPSGEQVPDKQNNEDDVSEFPSFEEHMQQVEQRKGEQKKGLIERAKEAVKDILYSKIRTEHNLAELNKPSIKNCRDEAEVDRLYDPLLQPTNSKDAIRKVLNNEPLQSEDIVGMGHFFGSSDDRAEMKQFIDDSGINNGKNFDISLPKSMYLSGGKWERTPLSISFENDKGTYTRIDIWNSERPDGGVDTVAVSYEGPREEGVDVGYDTKHQDLRDPETSNERIFMTKERFYPEQN